MQKWLFEILKDNTFVDNQTYQADNGVFKNHRLTNPIILENHKSRKTRPEHYADEIWKFLVTTNREVQNKLNIAKNKSLVLFNSKDYEHNSNDSFIEVSGTDCMNFTLKTGNIIGYIKKGDYSLKISSRYGDNFLKYIISDADGFIELEKFGGKTEGGYEWLIIYLWKTKIKKAYRLGIPKTYVTRNEYLSNVRGNIDALDYFIHSSTGIYKCNFREHSYNNDVSKLITETFKKIGNHEFLRELTMIRNAFYTATNGEKINRKEIFNTKNFSNPFYKDYNEVIELSKLILRNELSDFGEQSENNAFFFDISMLFEYFVKKMIKRIGFNVEHKFEKRFEIETGSETYKRKLEPDIVFHYHSNTFLFDVKYKSFDFIYGVSREDLFQIHTYIGQYGNIYNLKACGFIYPIASDKWDKLFNDKKLFIQQEINIMSVKLPFYILFIKIPDGNLNDFHTEFKKNCDLFLENISAIVGLENSNFESPIRIAASA